MGIPRPMSNAYSAEPVQEARAAGVLPASPNWDATPLELACPGFSYVRFYIAYEATAIGDDLTFRIEVSPYSADQAGVEDWFQEGDTLLAAPVLAAGADSTNLIQRQHHTYGAITAVVDNFEYLFPLVITVERIRISCYEVPAGDAGSAHIVALFGMW